MDRVLGRGGPDGGCFRNCARPWGWRFCGLLLGVIYLFAHSTGYGAGTMDGGEQSAFESFNLWAQNYLDAKSEARVSLLASEGVALARERSRAFSELIQSDPRRAVTSAIPAAIQRQLPAEVVALLEKQVSGPMDFAVLCALPTGESEQRPELRRVVRLHDRTYRVYTFGRGLLQKTAQLAAGSGVALGDLIALEEPPGGPSQKPGGSAHEPSEGGGPPVSPDPAGEQRILTIRVDFSDAPGEPWNGRYNAALVREIADTQVSPFFERSSFGKMRVEITVTPRLYRMPQTAAYYATTGMDYQLHTDAITAAEADYKTANYQAVVVLFPWLGSLPGSLMRFGGQAELGGWRVWVNGSFDFRVLAHELGHVYGLWHANSWRSLNDDPISAQGSSVDYDDPLDAMGGNWRNDPRADYNAWFKHQLNWLPGSQVLTVTNSGVFRLQPFDGSMTTGPLALKLARREGRHYWIGWRSRFTDDPTLARGAYVIWGYGQPGSSELLTLGALGGFPGKAGLAPGAALADADTGVTIMALPGDSENATDSLDVRIAFGSPPKIVEQPETAVVLAGQCAVFGIRVGGDPPPAVQWYRQARGAGGWLPLQDQNSYRGSTSTTLSLASALPGMDGDRFRCALTNSAGGFNWSKPVMLSVLDFGMSTFAGKEARAGANDGPGKAARFDSPQGLDLDRAGNLYVADTANSVIRVVAPDGVVTTLAGRPRQAGSADGMGGDARFKLPAAVAVDDLGNVYVADQGNSTIRLINSAGNVSTFAGAAGAEGGTDGLLQGARFRLPGGVALDRNGTVYVADTGNHTVRKIAASGVVSTLAGTAGNAGYLDGLAAAARFKAPSAVAVDSAGNVYVADQGNSTIRKIAPNGQTSTLAGMAGEPGNQDGTGGAARFSYPAGLDVDERGNIYLADRNNSALRVISPQGVVRTLRGTEANAGGPGVNFPCGVAVEDDGSLFIADTHHHAIRLLRDPSLLVLRLRIISSDHNTTLIWPASGSGFVLERLHPGLGSEGAAIITNPRVITGRDIQVHVDREAPAAFFRLRQP